MSVFDGCIESHSKSLIFSFLEGDSPFCRHSKFGNFSKNVVTESDLPESTEPNTESFAILIVCSNKRWTRCKFSKLTGS